MESTFDRYAQQHGYTKPGGPGRWLNQNGDPISFRFERDGFLTVWEYGKGRYRVCSQCLKAEGQCESKAVARA